jgi:hypothetical protein
MPRSGLAQILRQVLEAILKDGHAVWNSSTGSWLPLLHVKKKTNLAQPGPTDQVAGVEAASALQIGASGLESRFALIRLPLALETEGIFKPDLGSLGQHRYHARIETFAYVHQAPPRRF